MRSAIVGIVFVACITPVFAGDDASSGRGADTQRPEPIEMLIGTAPESQSKHAFSAGMATSEEIKEMNGQSSSIEPGAELLKDQELGEISQ